MMALYNVNNGKTMLEGGDPISRCLSASAWNDQDRNGTKSCDHIQGALDIFIDTQWYVIVVDSGVFRGNAFQKIKIWSGHDIG